MESDKGKIWPDFTYFRLILLDFAERMRIV